MADSQVIANLVYALFCLAPFCLGLAVFVGFAALLVWIIRRQWQPKDAATLAADRAAMQSQLDQSATSLRAWSPALLADLSTD